MNEDADRMLINIDAFYRLMIATGFFRYNLEDYGITLSEAICYQQLCKELNWIK